MRSQIQGVPQKIDGFFLLWIFFASSVPGIQPFCPCLGWFDTTDDLLKQVRKSNQYDGFFTELGEGNIFRKPPILDMSISLFLFNLDLYGLDIGVIRFRNQVLSHPLSGLPRVITVMTTIGSSRFHPFPRVGQGKSTGIWNFPQFNRSRVKNQSLRAERLLALGFIISCVEAVSRRRTVLPSDFSRKRSDGSRSVAEN